MIFQGTTSRVVVTIECHQKASFPKKGGNFQCDEELIHKRQCQNVGIAVGIVKTDDLVEEKWKGPIDSILELWFAGIVGMV